MVFVSGHGKRKGRVRSPGVVTPSHLAWPSTCAGTAPGQFDVGVGDLEGSHSGMDHDPCHLGHFWFPFAKGA